MYTKQPFSVHEDDSCIGFAGYSDMLTQFGHNKDVMNNLSQMLDNLIRKIPTPALWLLIFFVLVPISILMHVYVNKPLHTFLFHS